MSNQLIEYMKLHLISLEQDSAYLEQQMAEYEDLDGDDYRDLEIQDISINGQIIATAHLLAVAQEMIGLANANN